MPKITAERYHDFSYGHRVVGHENKCRHLHGHNGRVHFVCAAQQDNELLDHIGRVIDFTAIKEKLCMWVENNWDHKFLAWEMDHVMQEAYKAMKIDQQFGDSHLFGDSIIFLSFNPTAENMAEYLVTVIGPQQLAGTGVELISCKIEETAKCSATYHKDLK